MRHNQSTLSENVDVAILGAGISGLCLAHRLARAGRKVLVLESAYAPGGCFRSERQPAGFWFEMGAHTLYNSYGSLLSTIEELGLRDRMLTRKKAPYRLLVEGKLRSIPSRLSLPELFLSAWHAFSERKQGRTVADYYGRLLGQRNWKRVGAPLFATVFSQPADKFPAELSGGMVKRAALARALALDPDLLFLDEPTSGLDPIGAGDFDELIATLQHTLGLTVFMVTHDLDSLYAICDRVAVLGQGRVIAIGTISDLLRSEDPWIKTYFHGKRGAGREAAFKLGHGRSHP